MKAFRIWFYAAAAYNAIWGLVVSLLPNLPFELIGMKPLNHPAIMQCVGMMVGVYALGYYYIARDPERYANFVWIGILGKTFGPLGFLWAWSQGALPASWFFVILFNDLIWWPAFWMFALKHARGKAYSS